MKKKLTKFKIFRFLCLLAYIVCAGVLIFESSMDGTIVELINGIEVIRICDSLDFETNRFDNQCCW